MNRKAAIFMAMGFEALGLILACVYIGRWLDEKYGWNGIATATGGIVALIGWVTHILVVVRELAKSEESGHTDGQ